MRNAIKMLLPAALFMSLLFHIAVADDLIITETRSDQARSELGVTGNGVIIGIMDRGIDWTHPDFRNEDGTTRILFIFDLTDNQGASAPGNTYGVGTIYTKEEIDAALQGGDLLATRDAVGHGTATAGMAAGNGRASGGTYTGIAPEAALIIVKCVSEGAPAHGNQAAEAPFYNPALIPTAIDFILDKSAALALPVAILANFGSVGGPSDGTSELAKAIDDRFGAGKPGRVFVTGPGDDGGADNHAAGTITQGGSLTLQVRKAATGTMDCNIWYSGADRFDVSVQSPSGSYGPYQSPATNAVSAFVQQNDFAYYHQGADVDFYRATNEKRQILVRINGPAGDYNIELQGSSISDGSFNATLNPARFSGDSKFLNSVVPGNTVWDMASAASNISPNCYVVRKSWRDIDNIQRSVEEGPQGGLWEGSSVGPTWDGRLGVDVSVPGDRVYTTYAPNSWWGTFRHNLIQDGNTQYGIFGAVSGAAPTAVGIIALILQANPNLDAAQVKQILQETARSDAATGQTPNPQWGHGKIDALDAVRRADALTAVATPDVLSELPDAVRLLQNYPNPFNPSTTIRYALQQPQRVQIAIYNLLGKKIRVLIDAQQPAGVHLVRWDGRDQNGVEVVSGAYFYEYASQKQTLRKKMLLLK